MAMQQFSGAGSHAAVLRSPINYAAFDPFPAPIFVFDTAGRVGYANANGADLIGWLRDDTRDFYLWDMLDRGEEESARSLFECGLILGEIPPCEFGLRRKAAPSVRMRFHWRVLIESGRASGLLGVAWDAGAPQELASAVQESEQHFHRLAENLPGVVFRCDYEGSYSFEYLAGMVSEVTGCEKDELLGGSVGLADLIDPEDLDKVVAEHEASLEENRPCRYKFRLRNQDRGVRWINGMGRALPGNGPEDRALFDGFLYDITERVEAEAD